jgi:hypothetical protein
VKEASKSTRETAILVDDYLGNVTEYLRNTPGVAILVDRPWNQSRTEVAEQIKNGRLYIVKALGDIPQTVDAIESKTSIRMDVESVNQDEPEDSALAPPSQLDRDEEARINSPAHDE